MPNAILRSGARGLAADIDWFGGSRANLRQLILSSLLPLAQSGLETVGVDSTDINRYLSIIERRVESELTGAAWQRAFAERYGRDFSAMVQAYLKRQESDIPVHEWPL
ncbi:hypothetical protein [Alkalilimnicola ehrlichii]|uniref:hypothetical protein n=1 Tax=Alkalilimnicola ehrlichii TaxID=351052 RepID=UPI00216174B6|nr:hypothetical protein [Alkalilimnicola ehrlichii]